MSGPYQRIALITGATGGVGDQLAGRLLDEGWTVLAHGNSSRSGRAHPSLRTFQCDLRTSSATHQLVDWTRSHCGPDGLSLLVHCAAALQDPATVSDWDEALTIYAINCLSGTTLVTALRPELQRASGTAVMVSSSSAKRYAPGQLAYAATKAALETAVTHLGYELGSYGVRVIGVRPTLIDTPMSAPYLDAADNRRRLSDQIPLGHVGTAREVANAIVALASSDAAWITGQTIWLDGGATLGWNESIIKTAAS